MSNFEEKGTFKRFEDAPVLHRVDLAAAGDDGCVGVQRILRGDVGMGPYKRIGKKPLHAFVDAFGDTHKLRVETQGFLSPLHLVYSESIRADPHSITTYYQATALWLCEDEHRRVDKGDTLHVHGNLLLPDACVDKNDTWRIDSDWPIFARMVAAGDGSDGGNAAYMMMRSMRDVHCAGHSFMHSLQSKEDVLAQARVMRHRAEQMLSHVLSKRPHCAKEDPLWGGIIPACISQMQPCLVVSRRCSFGTDRNQRNVKKGFRILFVITFDRRPIIQNPITLQSLRTIPRFNISLLLYMAMCQEQEAAFWSATHAEALAGLASVDSRRIAEPAKRVLSIALDPELMQGLNCQATTHQIRSQRISVLGKLIIHQMNDVEPLMEFEMLRQDVITQLLMGAVGRDSPSPLKLIGIDLLGTVLGFEWMDAPVRHARPPWASYGLREYLGPWRTHRIAGSQHGPCLPQQQDGDGE